MNELLEYLSAKFIKVDSTSGDKLCIDGRWYQYVPPTNGKIIDEDFALIADRTECDGGFIFYFGGRWYSTPRGTEDDPKLNPLMYIGQADGTPTESFLGVHGTFELMNGNRGYKDWVRKAKFLGCKSLGICEKNTLAGALKFQNACVAANIRPIIGAMYSVYRPAENIKYDVRVYAKDEKGWMNILLMNKEVNVSNQKYINEPDFVKLAKNVVVVLDPKSLSFDRIFPLDLSISKLYWSFDTVVYSNRDRDDEYIANLLRYAKSDLPALPFGDAYYLEQEDAHIKVKLNKIGSIYEHVSSNQYFKSSDDYIFELAELIGDDEKAYKFFNKMSKNLSIVANSCKFKIEQGSRHLPKYKLTKEESELYSDSRDMFVSLLDKELVEKFGGQKAYSDRLELEKKVILDADVHDYFLMTRDILNWCREQGILVGIGRGSAGGTLIGYLLGIHYLDPIRYDLLFERFLNEGRAKVSLPDIDTDVEGLRRDEVKQYIERRFGEKQVCSIGTYSTLQMKAAIKDFSRLADVDFGLVNQVTSVFDTDTGEMEDFFKNALSKGTVYDFMASYPDVVSDISLVLHQPKSQSIHACAMVILPDERDIYHWIPVKKMTAKGGESILVSEWEGGEIESIGLLKEDLLATTELDKLRSVLNLVKDEKGIDLSIYDIPLDDMEVLRYFRNGWTGNVFHFNTSGLTGYIKQLQPQDLEDLIAAISLYRPGTMENNFHNKYVNRKAGTEDVDYIWGAKHITEKTYGLIVYQEQVMRICQDLGGFSLVEADDIRKAMGKKKLDVILKYREKFLAGATKNGCDEHVALDIWDQLVKFASYSFNRSHAAAYTITGYIGMWLKVHYPVQFWASAISFASKDEYPIFLSEIHQTEAVKVNAIDVNRSGVSVYVDAATKSLYWSIKAISGVGEVSVEQILSDRASNGDYFDFQDFLDRSMFKGSKVNKTAIEGLVLSGAFDKLEYITHPRDRIRLLESYYAIIYPPKPPRKDGKPREVQETILTRGGDFIMKNWWWVLQQKSLSGIAFFDYETIFAAYGSEVPVPYIDPDEFAQYTNTKGKNIKRAVCGYVSEVEVRESKRGMFAKITIENNYKFIPVTVWSEEFIQFEHLINASHKKIMIVSGYVGYDKFKKTNTLQTTGDSKMILLG